MFNDGSFELFYFIQATDMRKDYSKRAVVVDQLVERSLLALKIRGSNPNIGKIL